jgi:hypothetical protein
LSKNSLKFPCWLADWFRPFVKQFGCNVLCLLLLFVVSLYPCCCSLYPCLLLLFSLTSYAHPYFLLLFALTLYANPSYAIVVWCIHVVVCCIPICYCCLLFLFDVTQDEQFWHECRLFDGWIIISIDATFWIF